jgi:hypothetical protein
MARFNVNAKVRLRGTLVTGSVTDLFDDGENSKYMVMFEGRLQEVTEEQLQPTILDTLKDYFFWLFSKGDLHYKIITVALAYFLGLAFLAMFH